MKCIFTLLLLCFILPCKAQADTLSINDNRVYKLEEVDVKPEYPGGQKAFFKLLTHNIKFGNVSENRQVKIIVSYCIEKDGTLTTIKLLDDPGDGIGDEIIRVMNLSEKWVPGQINGTAVRTEMKLPVN